MKIINFIAFSLLNKLRGGYCRYVKSKLGYCGTNVCLGFPASCQFPQNLYLYDNTNIYDYFKFISYTGKFIMKKNSGAAQGLTIITGNHHRIPGVLLKKGIKQRNHDIEKDIIVEEDVWIGANVTLLDGCHIGRGAVIGAGSVVRTNILPYAIVVGNPSKIVGFVFSPEEVRKHEEKLYPMEERISVEEYEKNYQRYFIDRINDIKKFLKL